MAGSRTLSVTFTMRLTEPLTKEEKDAVIVSLWEHIRDERAEGMPGFTKIVSAESSGRKHRISNKAESAKPAGKKK
jgi:hypothetical protein